MYSAEIVATTGLSIVSAIVTATGLVLGLRKQLKEEFQPYTIIGIVHVKVPSALYAFPDFTSLAKLRRSRAPVRILHCTHLSYALRKCDFVIADAGADEKIISPDDTVRINAIAEVKC